MPGASGESTPVTYQEFVSLCRRYDRDQLLWLLYQASRSWDGETSLPSGEVKNVLPWTVAGVAAVLICRGTGGGRHPAYADVELVCNRFMHLVQPGPLNGIDDLVRGLSRYISQQAPHQRAGLAELSRPVALYVETAFPASYSPGVMTEGWDEELLGASVARFVSIGFCLWAAALSGSRYPFPWDEGMLAVVEDMGGIEIFSAVTEAQFLTDIDAFKTARRSAVDAPGGTPNERFVREPFAYNPLVAKPLIGGIVPGEWIAPCVQMIELRTSVQGVLYSGLERWGQRFTDDAGQLFEQYVGRQLRLMEHASVIPEVVYQDGRQTKKTIDWFVVLSEAVLLIECKNSVPTAAVREGLDGFGDAHQRLDKGIEQINNTAQLIREGQPELSAIPADRPLIGLVVTLGNWDFANEVYIRAQMTTASIPTSIVGVGLIEQLVTLAGADWSVFIGKSASLVQPTNVIEARNWLDGLTLAENPILKTAFESLPVIAALGHSLPSPTPDAAPNPPRARPTTPLSRAPGSLGNNQEAFSGDIKS